MAKSYSVIVLCVFMLFLTSFLDNPGASKPEACNASVKGDIFLLVDITNNMVNAGQGVSIFIEFLQALISTLTIGGKAIRIGIIFYDDRAILVSNLTYNVAEIQKKIAGMQSHRDPQSSKLYQALKFLLDKGFKTKIGSRPGVPRIGLIISNEWPNQTESVDKMGQDTVRKLKRMGVKLLYAGDKGIDTMTNFVSKPVEENMFFLIQYDVDAVQNASSIASKICGRLAKLQLKRTSASIIGTTTSSTRTSRTSPATVTKASTRKTATGSATVSPQEKKPISRDAPEERTFVTPPPEEVNKNLKKPISSDTASANERNFAIPSTQADNKRQNKPIPHGSPKKRLFVTTPPLEADDKSQNKPIHRDSPKERSFGTSPPPEADDKSPTEKPISPEEMAFEPNDQAVKARLVEARAQMGFLPNALKVFARRPAEFKTFFNHFDTLMANGKGNLTKTDKEMIAIASGAANKCVYCVIQHSAMHRKYSKNPILADQIATNWKQAELNGRQKAILRFAMAVCHAETITEKHFKDLEKFGLTKEDAWDIAAITAFYAMENRMALAANVKPNREFYAMGREIKSNDGSS